MVGICLYTPLCICTPPYVHTPPVHLYTPIHLYSPPGCTHPPGPPMFLCSCMVLAHCMLWGVAFLFYAYWDTPPLFGGTSPFITPPTLCWFSVHCYSQGYQFLCGPFSPSIEGFGGVPPITGGGWGDTSVAVHMLILLHLFCSALCLMSQPRLRLLLLQLQWYLLACHQCRQYQWLLL